MRIGMFTDTYTPQINGVVTSINSFTQELEKAGHQVFIFAPRLENSVEKENVFYFKSVKYPPMPEHQLAYSFSGHFRIFRDLKLDIIHSHTPFSLGWLALFLAKQYQIPLVHTYHTLFAEYVHYVPTAIGRRIGVWLSTNASRKYCHSCDLTIVPSEAMRQELQKYGVTNEIDVIPTGISDYFRSNGDPQSILAKHQIPQDIDVIAYAGRIAKEKNIEFLLRSFQKIAAQKPETRLMIVAFGPYQGVLQKLAQELGIADKVIFTGRVERTEVYNYLKAGDLFVCASKTETQGLVISEAKACGKPAVAINARGIAQMIENGVDGYLTPDDVEVFTQKVLAVLADPAELARLSAGADKNAKEKFLSSAVTKKLEALYNSLLSK